MKNMVNTKKEIDILRLSPPGDMGGNITRHHHRPPLTLGSVLCAGYKAHWTRTLTGSRLSPALFSVVVPNHMWLLEF